MRRLMETVRSGRVDLTPLTHALVPAGRHSRRVRVVRDRRDGVIKVAIRP
jgi:hypothetical protein